MTMRKWTANASIGNTLRRRFESKFVPEPMTGCWLWTANAYEYRPGVWRPLIQVLKEQQIASRVSYEIYVGPIPEGIFVCHHCDTPMCVKPEHLFLGTAWDNSRDAVAKGRTARGIGNGMAKLTEEIVRAIFSDSRTQNVIAAEYGVSQSRISSIKRKASWGHIHA